MKIILSEKYAKSRYLTEKELKEYEEDSVDTLPGIKETKKKEDGCSHSLDIHCDGGDDGW